MFEPFSMTRNPFVLWAGLCRIGGLCCPLGQQGLPTPSAPSILRINGIWAVKESGNDFSSFSVKGKW